MRILVVEDERLLCDGIAEDLRLEKYTVDCCYDGPAACERLFVEPYDLVVLDLNLPGMDGLELLRHIRTEQPELRVLILSARSQLSDKVAGLDLGADDYLTKPFALEELEARVRTLLRREFRQRESLVQVGALTLNTVTREVSGRGEPLPLTPREFAILEHLMLHRGCWISQEELMEHIWEADANPFSNAVRMHISSLRKKLRKRLGHDPIQTKVGRGYRLAGEETAMRKPMSLRLRVTLLCAALLTLCCLLLTVTNNFSAIRDGRRHSGGAASSGAARRAGRQCQPAHGGTAYQRYDPAGSGGVPHAEPAGHGCHPGVGPVPHIPAGWKSPCSVGHTHLPDPGADGCGSGAAR